MDTPRFAVDKMLGRLATWLRLIGQDTMYGSHLSGRTLVRSARAQGRIILTRNRNLLRESRSVPVIFVKSDHFRDQLQQIVATYKLEPFARLFWRCSRCNEMLTPVSKAEIACQVPPYVFASQDRFVRCPHCLQIYWPATHYDRIRDELRAMGFMPHPDTSA